MGTKSKKAAAEKWLQRIAKAKLNSKFILKLTYNFS